MATCSGLVIVRRGTVRPPRLVLTLLLTLGTASGLIAAAQVEPPAVAPFGVSVATPGGDLPGDVAVQLVKVVEGLVDPVNVTHAGDGSGRIFVVERVGRIRVIANGVLLDEPFLDYSHRVEYGHLEQGMLGLAFDPNYEANGYVYVSYTDYDRNGDFRLVRFTVSEENPNRVDPSTFRLILSQDKPTRVHNAGELGFGPDGYLYVAIGDGGRASAPFEMVPPSLDNLLGKILRIDVHREENGLPYAIPRDNPFNHTLRYPPQVRREIWAHGLRNPWQFSFDRQTGDLYIGDVGDARVEEINFQPADSIGGEDYGWNSVEGVFCWPDWQRFPDGCEAVGVPPVATYPHGDLRCAVVGLGVYRGSASPGLDGVYFNGDYCSGRIFGLARDAAGAWVYRELLDTRLVITGGGEDEAGELYVTTCTCNAGRHYNPFENPTGKLWRLVAADRVPPQAEVAPIDPDVATPRPIGTPLVPADFLTPDGTPPAVVRAGEATPSAVVSRRSSGSAPGTRR
jgi:glucose/arabinose dehydrogenase